MFNYLSSLSATDLEKWNATLPFKSLYTKYYEENIPVFFVEDYESDNLPTYTLNETRVGDVFASLLNSDGITSYANTIIKVEGEYLYKLSKEDFSSYQKKGILPSEDNVKIKHTTEIESEDTSTGMLRAYKDKTSLFYVNNKTRDVVVFKASKSGNGSTYTLELVMKGKRQKKVLGVWLLPYVDRIGGTITVSTDTGFRSSKVFPHSSGKVTWNIANITGETVTVRYDYMMHSAFHGTKICTYKKSNL